MLDQAVSTSIPQEQTNPTQAVPRKSHLGRYLKIGCSVLVLFICLVFVFLLYSFGLFSPEEYSADSIKQLKREVFIGSLGTNTENWEQLEIAEKLDNLDKVTYVYRPARGTLQPFLRAKIEFSKEINSKEEMNTLLDKALIKSGKTPQVQGSGVYCVKRNSKGYFKTDVLVFSTEGDDFPASNAYLAKDYGDSWQQCIDVFGLTS